MKKIYVISSFIDYNDDYSHIALFGSIFQESDSGYYAPIYGWTFDKKLAKMFIKTHNKKYFMLKTIDIDDESEEKFLNFYKDLRIDYFDYSTSLSSAVNILSTEWERNVSSREVGSELDSYAYDVAATDYSIFKDNYIDALDYLSYTSFHDMFIGGDPRFAKNQNEWSERQERAFYNAGYNLTVMGRPLELFSDTDYFKYCKTFIGIIDKDNVEYLIQPLSM